MPKYRKTHRKCDKQKPILAKFKTFTNKAEIASAVIVVLPFAFGVRAAATANLQFIVAPRSRRWQAQRLLYIFIASHCVCASAHT